MSFIELPLDDVQEQEPVPEGNYELQITSAKERVKEETGRTMILCTIQILNPPSDVENPAPIFEYLSLPMQDDERNTRQMLALNIKRFLAVFGIPNDNGFDILDFPGATGECFVKETEFEGNPKNEIVLPRLEK